MTQRIIIAILMLATISSCSPKQVNEISNSEPVKPKNIIFMIGDGMGVSEVYAALTAKKGELEMARCKHTGFVKTYAADNYITDSAAGATAFATGRKTDNGKLSLSPQLDTLNTILEYAEFNGLGTGLVATAKITHATPAGYIAHNPSRNNYEEIALDFLKTDVDVLLGGGRNNFEKRADSVNLLDQFRAKNYQIVFDTAGMMDVHQGKLFGLLWEDHPPKWKDGRDDFLSKASLKAIELLNPFEKGFFLMIEGSQIDWGGHDNDTEYLVAEAVDFDNAVGEVLDFAQQDGETLVVITADHETGGFGINGGSMETGEVIGGFTTGNHTSTMVPMFAYGPGAKEFMGVIDNTDIFFKFMKLLNLKEELKVNVELSE